MINKNIVFLPAIALMIASCSVNTNTGSIINPNPVKVENKADFSNSYSIQIKIKGPAGSGFKLKDSKSQVNGKTFEDIKSFSAFLTTDYNDPFAAGSNPKGDGVMVNVNATTETGFVTINISDIPAGGPYFAVVAAFDDVVGGDSRDNITLPDADICNNPEVECSSSDINWSRSNNNVTVDGSGGFTFSDDADQLEADLNLKGGEPNYIGAEITFVDGSTELGPIDHIDQN